MKSPKASPPRKRRMLWIILLSTIAVAWTTPIPLIEDSEEIEEPCFEPCYCEVKESLFHIHCDNKGFINISQITESWSRPFKLYLQRNSMRRLYTNSFLHLNNAVSINLGNNALQDIQTGAFNGLKILKRLYLHENKLDIFRNDTFLGLESLEYLQADYNVIKRIESGAFRNLSKLRVLILNDNLIPLLPTNLFKSVSLTHLDLRGNRLKVLSYRGMLDHIGRSLGEPQVEEHPWGSTCEMVQPGLHINDLGLTVNCKERGFHNISELLPRPVNAKKLYLSGNLIQKIYRSDFWNFSSLDLLHLGNNRISYVQDGAFINLPNLNRLYLNGNDIERLTPGMFRGLQSLHYQELAVRPDQGDVRPAAGSLCPAECCYSA
uniref:SLIT and NTRK-like protein 3 n=1 Tax=Sphaerodactylus townsendi TaxID=933632 RepID=A0ACB8FBE4_9SAUR